MHESVQGAQLNQRFNLVLQDSRSAKISIRPDDQELSNRLTSIFNLPSSTRVNATRFVDMIVLDPASGQKPMLTPETG